MRAIIPGRTSSQRPLDLSTPANTQAARACTTDLADSARCTIDCATRERPVPVGEVNPSPMGEMT